MKRFGAAVLAILAATALPSRARAESSAQKNAQGALRDLALYYRAGQYFKAARYAFEARQLDRSTAAQDYSWITLSLIHAGLNNAASYFFIRTLQSGDREAIRRVLTHTQTLLTYVGDDLLRKYLIRHTAYEDYDAMNRSAYLYSLGKDALLAGEQDRAIGYLNGMRSDSPLWPYALELRGAAHAIRGESDSALEDFRRCASRSGDVVAGAAGRRDAQDLRARCLAGVARTLYQMDRFEQADRAYDDIPKTSIVWPDLLFEHAWNAYAQHEYNRALGKLVTYKSPALEFVFNSEIDVLRAQSYLALCLYDDANDAVNDFNRRYAGVGVEAKHFVERNANDLSAFYRFGRDTLRAPLYTQDNMRRLANRFVRGPYFRNLVASERSVASEREAIRRLDAYQPGVGHVPGQGFPGFLDQVLGWRARSIELLGGAFIKNSLMDYHAALLADFDKIAFIKLEMLKEAKESLMTHHAPAADRSRGNVEPSRRDDQYYWSFNGEFWDDELGDYVFGLESACGKATPHG